MKNILLISDSHGYLDPKLSKHAQDADEIWHAGDIGPADLDSFFPGKTIRAVYGNIDSGKTRLDFEEYLYFETGSVKALMIHIAGSFGRYNTTTTNLIQKFSPSILVCGHSHILKIAFDHQNNLLYMNPGACGMHGFHQIRTAVKFSINNGTFSQAYVIELGKRSLLT